MNASDKIVARLMSHICALLGLNEEDVSPQSALSELGFSSLSLARLATRVSDEFKVDLEPAAFLECELVVELATYISVRSQARLRPRIADEGELMDGLIQAILEVSGVESSDIHPGRQLGEYGLDSVKLTSLAAKLQKRFGVVVEPLTFLENDNVDKLARWISGERVAREGGRSSSVLERGSRIAVIGAGPGGLAAAKCLRDDGFEPIVLERTDRIGGTYVFRDDHVGGPYESLTMQSSKYTFFFSDCPAPAEIDLFPTVEQVNSYLHSYIQRFNLEGSIHLEHDVQGVRKRPGGWTVSAHTPAGDKSFNVSGVLMCCGSYWIPKTPRILGLDEFGGEVLNSSQYHNNAIFRNKRVLVIGGGVSGCDIAAEAADVALSVSFSTRRKTWVLPSMLGYVPSELTASFADRWKNGSTGPAAFKRKLESAMPEYMALYERSGLLPSGVNNNAISTSDDIVRKVAEQQVRLTGEVVRFDARGAHFHDGSFAEIDIIVFCAGYEEMPIPFEHTIRPTDFYEYTFYPEDPTLARMSVPYVLSKQRVVLASALPFLELIGRWYCGVITGRSQLPDAQQMGAWCEKREAEKAHPFIFDGWLESLRIAFQIGAFPRPETDWNLYWDLINLPPLSLIFRLTGPHAWDGASEMLRQLRRKLFLGKDSNRNDDVKHAVLKGLGQKALLRMLSQKMISVEEARAAIEYAGAALTPYLTPIEGTEGQHGDREVVAAHYVNDGSAGRSDEACDDKAKESSVELLSQERESVELTRRELRQANEPIAVVGLALRLPGCQSLADFWNVLMSQSSVIERVPAGRWDWQEYDGDPGADGRTDAHFGSFVSGLEFFDAKQFGLSADEAKFLDPQSRMLFEASHTLVETAGFGSSMLRGRKVGVVVGVQRQEFLNKVLSETREFSPAIENGSFQGFMVNRLAHHFDWRGPTFAVNSACASSSVAMHLAIQSLRSGEADYAIAGGVNYVQSPLSSIAERRQGGLTGNQEVRAFDRGADGTVIGDGCGLLMLQPLSSALAEGNHIIGVVLATALSNSGRTLYQLAPSATGQSQVIREALGKAGVSPGEVDYIEGQGAATAIADQAELSAYKVVFGEVTEPPRITNLKSNIGHLETASGVVATTKMLMSMNTGQVPGIRNVVDFGATVGGNTRELKVVQNNEVWRQRNRARRIATVHNFGAGGINAHTVLAWTPSTPARPGGKQQRLCLFSAPTKEQLEAYLRSIADFIEREEFKLLGVNELLIADVAYTLAHRRKHYPVRYAIVVEDIAQLQRFLISLPSDMGDCFADVGAACDGPKEALTRQGRAWASGEGEVDFPKDGRAIPLPGLVFRRSRLWPFTEESSSSRKPITGRAGVRQEASGTHVAAAIAELVSAIASKVLHVASDQLDPDESLGYLGFDSPSIKLFAAELSERLDFQVNTSLLFAYPTLRALTSYLSEEARVGIVRAQSASSVAEQTVIDTRKRDKAVAIVGLAGRLPGAQSKEVFWQNQEQRRNCITEVPESRWNWLEVFGDPVRENGKTNVKWGGFIDGIDQFSPSLFGLSRYEAELMDPQHRLFLKTVWESIWDAGYDPKGFAGRSVGVFAGVQFQEYQQLLSRAGLVNGQTCTGNAHSMLPNRVSFFLDVNGPSQTVDTACSSSLVALHQAVRSIQAGDCEIAIAGGVNLLLLPDVFVMGSHLGVLSPSGQCKTFDAKADGYVRGEGVVAVLLKPLSMAEADRDHIYGVILGSAVNHGGRAASLTAPNSRAQTNLIASAVREAKVSPADISYIEMHGTGTELGDPIEIEGIKAAFRELGGRSSVEAGGPCALGSVKTNIGHLEAAAGLAGLTNVLMAMQSGTLPGLSNFENINPRIDLGVDEGFVVQAETVPWETRAATRPRTAIVNSFGFGGANASIVVQEYVHSSLVGQDDHQSVMYIPLAASDLNAQAAYAERLLRAVEVLEHSAADGSLLQNIAYTLQNRGEDRPVRVAIKATSVLDLKVALRALSRGTSDKELVAPTAVAEGDWPQFVRQWLAGNRQEWPELKTARRIPLPVSPWPDQRCWFESVALPQTQDLKPEVKPFFLEQVWRRVGAPQMKEDGVRSRNVIVITRSNKQAAHFKPLISRKVPGAKVSVVDFTLVAGDIESAISMKPDIIIVLPAEASVQPQIDGLLRSEVKFVFCLVRQIMERAASRNIQVYYASAYEFGSAPAIDALAGLARSAFMENRRLRLSLVFFEQGSRYRWPELLIGEIAVGPHDRPAVVCYDPERKVRGIRQIELPNLVSQDESWFRKGGVYLFAGGAGELGARLLEALLREVDATFVLLGRTSPTKHIEERIGGLRKIARHPDLVRYEQCDISDLAALSHVVGKLHSQYGVINGVLNFVTDHSDAFIFNKTWDEFQQVSSCKVNGTSNLDLATASIALDFFVTFSSQATLGMAGGSDYAYGCAFQDAFATWRNREMAAGRRRGRCVTINWSRWQWDKYVTVEFDAWIESLGYQLIGLEEGLRSWKLIMESAAERLFVFSGNEEQILQAFDLEFGLMIADRQWVNSAGSGSTKTDELQSDIKATMDVLETLSDERVAALAAEWLPNRERSQITSVEQVEASVQLAAQSRNISLETDVQFKLSANLGKLLKADAIDPNIEFRTLGVDSILAFKLVSNLEDTFKIDVSPKWFFDFPTVTSLSKQIASYLSRSADGLG